MGKTLVELAAEGIVTPEMDAEVRKALAAHIGDLTKLPERTRPRDLAMGKARRDLDWEGQFNNALFPEDAMRIRAERAPSCDDTVCTMCGEFCANRASSVIFHETLRHGEKA